MSERAAPSRRAVISHRPATIATGAAIALVVAYLLAPRMGGDLSAQMARADFAANHPWSPVDLRWFGGTLPYGYSLWVPPLMAVVGPRLVGAIAAVAATWLTTRLMMRAGASRPTIGGLLAAICQASNLAEGRVAFAAGLAFGLATLLALTSAGDAELATGARNRRIAGATIMALLAGAASPVAALLLWLCGAVALLRRRFAAAAILVLASAIPVVVISVVFADGGHQLYDPVDALRAALVSALVVVFVPARHQAIRIGGALGVLMVAAAYLLPTPVGGNASRLALLFAVPVVAAFVPWRWWIAGLAVVATAIAQTPVTLGTLTGAGTPATEAAYYAPLLAEIKSDGPLTGRIEVPELNGHWEAAYLARTVPLARGWLRQVDTELNDDVFYKHKPTAATYQQFLRDNAVEYVAVPDARLTFYGKRESSLISTDLSYLEPIWKNDHWTLYRVANAVPVVDSPGTLISENAASITFSAPPGSEVTINVRYFRWWTTSTAGSCVERAGNKVLFKTGSGPATPYVLSSSLNPQHC
jgi:hypothetical protein